MFGVVASGVEFMGVTDHEPAKPAKNFVVESGMPLGSVAGALATVPDGFQSGGRPPGPP
jgi:hypothetical protein